MESYITDYIESSSKTILSLRNNFEKKIVDAVNLIYDSFRNDGKLMICGNGGSASDSQHISAELVNRFRYDRSPLPAIALTTDTSNITAISNDYSFDLIFTKQIQAIANPQDCLLAISTSGNSKNIINALKTAKEIGCSTISLTGKDGGVMPCFSNIAIIVPSTDTPHIQEAHLVIEHIMCDLIEQILIKDTKK
ncbi:D-sedoheptulose 7-phosphate isomerase [bacterium]|nr:D-sedoheptulose 7-phosphate isomerase [bacterium]